MTVDQDLECDDACISELSSKCYLSRLQLLFNHVWWLLPCASFTHVVKQEAEAAAADSIAAERERSARRAALDAEATAAEETAAAARRRVPELEEAKRAAAAARVSDFIL